MSIVTTYTRTWEHADEGQKIRAEWCCPSSSSCLPPINTSPWPQISATLFHRFIFSAPRPRHCATLVLLFFHHFSSLPRIKSMSWVTDASNWHGWKYTTHVLNCRPSSKYINDIQLNDENKGVRSKKSFSTRCVSAETWQWVVTHSTIGQSPRHVCGFHTLQIIVSIQNVRLSSWR